MKVIKITVEKLDTDKVEPFPYLVFKGSQIGDQDIWQGVPAFLLGFSKKPKTGQIDLLFRVFWKKPKKAKGMYPVFRTLDGRWYIEKIKVEKVGTIKKEYKDILKMV